MIDSRGTPRPDGTSSSRRRRGSRHSASRGPVMRAALALRISLLGWSLVLLLGAIMGFVLGTVWITSVSIVALGLGIPLTLLATVLVRWFADLHRQWAADRLGEPAPARPLSLIHI